jgi:hypothetical protein
VSPLDALIKKATVEELKKTAFDLLATLGFPVASWAGVAVIRTIVVLFCRLLAPFTDAAAVIAASGFLDYATGAALTLLAKQVYNVDRRLAARATGTLTLNNSGGGLYSFAAYQARFLAPGTNKLYQNTAPFTLNPLQTGLSVAVEALEAGTASTATAGTITLVEPSLLGVTCTNAAALIGVDEETDAEVRALCRAKLGSLSPNGPAAAYEYIAKSFDLNGGVVVTRTLAIADSPTGEVTLYIAGPTGSVTAPDVATVQGKIHRLCEPLCVDATVLSAVPYTLNVVATAYVYTSQNVTDSAVQAQGLAALVAYVPTVPIGGHRAATNGVQVNALEGVLRSSVVHQAVVTSPASDVVLASERVVVLGSVTINVVQVTPPEGV